jgi:hypothetical protein
MRKWTHHAKRLFIPKINPLKIENVASQSQLIYFPPYLKRHLSEKWGLLLRFYRNEGLCKRRSSIVKRLPEPELEPSLFILSILLKFRSSLA